MRRKGDLIWVALVVLSCLGNACGPNSTVLNSGKGTPVPITGDRPKSSFENDLETMRTANFAHVFALRRKDGAAFDKDDKKFLREHTPPEINRVVLSDDDKALIAGSHFPFSPEALKLLQSRFNFEDYSSLPNTTPEKSANSNVNK